MPRHIIGSNRPGSVQDYFGETDRISANKYQRMLWGETKFQMKLGVYVNINKVKYPMQLFGQKYQESCVGKYEVGGANI